MRVLVCATEFYPYSAKGGIGVCLHNIVDSLKKEGVQCDVCSPYGPNIKVPVEFISNRHYGVLSLLRFWQGVSREIRDIVDEYDAIWLHQPFILSKFPSSRCLVTMHTSIFDYNTIVQNSGFSANHKIYYSFRQRIEKQCLRNINSYAPCFSVVSPHIKTALEKIGISSNKITCIPNGVDIEKFKPSLAKERLKKSFGITENNIVFAFVGRISEQKRPLALLKFFSKLSSRMSNISLIVAGEGNLLKDLIAIASTLRMNNVKFIGYVEDSELPSVYACSDVYVIPSVYEGQPITVLEAMASGVPIVASDIPPLIDIIEDSGVGIVVDFDKLNENIDYVSDYFSKDLQDKSAKARDFIINNHTWGKIGSQYLSLLRNIASNY